MSSPVTPARADAAGVAFLTADAFRQHWQGHRRLTRRMIEAFPEDKLFTFSIGGMRSFGDLAWELVRMAAPMVRGAATGEWAVVDWKAAPPQSRDELLRAWDQSTADIDANWARIPAERFNETITAFGSFTGVTNDLLLYTIDNEVHHRGQGYVYLRALGIEPPPFWERQ
ncbi:DinB family protein [Gemmatirosa kalamazoonensis]|uniref:DinB family protein n=1 Tax=Gemmatirosa kalamazoonensis TaxID=861299 RepID=W0RKP3_9BACT|nr:DinB family protein [Gemmatirosa kalamazoonensis]AHG91654.1 DinB family protein [Gemmatirosa kalamazoonensis]